MRTIRKRLLALLLTVAMLGTLFAGLPIASAASEALGNVTDAAVDGNTLLLTIDSGGSASDLLTLEVCQDNILRVDYQPESVAYLGYHYGNGNRHYRRSHCDPDRRHAH